MTLTFDLLTTKMGFQDSSWNRSLVILAASVFDIVRKRDTQTNGSENLPPLLPSAWAINTKILVNLFPILQLQFSRIFQPRGHDRLSIHPRVLCSREQSMRCEVKTHPSTTTWTDSVTRSALVAVDWQLTRRSVSARVYYVNSHYTYCHFAV